MMVVEAPDQGWAWAVAFAVCLINFIIAGLGRMSGVLFVAFIDIFHLDRRTASMPFSIRNSMQNLLGPVVGILGQKYGNRKVIVIGAVIATVSSMCCFFATDVLWITILWGGFSGIGAALTTCTYQVVVGQYFKKHKSTAAGMGFSGSCVGSFLFPAMMEYLILNYGIAGTFLFLAGIVMHSIPAAMILKKPSWLSKTANLCKSDYKNQISPLSKVNQSTSDSDKYYVNNSLDLGMNLDLDLLQQNSKLVTTLLMLKSTTDLGKDNYTNDSEPILKFCIQDTLEAVYHRIRLEQKDQLNTNVWIPENKMFQTAFHKNDFEYISSHKNRSFHFGRKTKRNFDNIAKTNSLPNISKICHEMSMCQVCTELRNLLEMKTEHIFDQLPDVNKEKVLLILDELRKFYYYKNVEVENKKYDYFVPDNGVTQTAVITKPESKAISNTLGAHIKTALEMYRKPIFLLISFCRVVHFLTFFPALTVIVDFIIDKGMKAEEGKYFIASLSLGDLLGRLCLGWVTDRGFISLSRFMLITMVFQGVNTAMLPLYHSRVILHMFLCLFGLFQGALFVRYPVLVAKYLGNNEQSIAMGSMNFFPGVVGLLLPSYIGFFRDTLGAYNHMFFINGAICATMGLLWTLEPFLSRRHSISDDEQK